MNVPTVAAVEGAPEQAEEKTGAQGRRSRDRARRGLMIHPFIHPFIVVVLSLPLMQTYL